VTDNITCRVPAQLRDADGVRLDAMLESAGARIIRELPRVAAPAGWVDLLLEHTSAPAEIRGEIVLPIYDEVDDGVERVLSFDRWARWSELEAGAVLMAQHEANMGVPGLVPDGPQ
jgi:hypothetical protein